MPINEGVFSAPDLSTPGQAAAGIQVRRRKLGSGAVTKMSRGAGPYIVGTREAQ